MAFPDVIGSGCSVDFEMYLRVYEQQKEKEKEKEKERGNEGKEKGKDTAKGKKKKVVKEKEEKGKGKGITMIEAGERIASQQPPTPEEKRVD